MAKIKSLFISFNDMQYIYTIDIQNIKKIHENY